MCDNVRENQIHLCRWINRENCHYVKAAAQAHSCRTSLLQNNVWGGRAVAAGEPDAVSHCVAAAGWYASCAYVSGYVYGVSSHIISPQAPNCSPECCLITLCIRCMLHVACIVYIFSGVASETNGKVTSRVYNNSRCDRTSCRVAVAVDVYSSSTIPHSERNMFATFQTRQAHEMLSTINIKNCEQVHTIPYLLYQACMMIHTMHAECTKRNQNNKSEFAFQCAQILR